MKGLAKTREGGRACKKKGGGRACKKIEARGESACSRSLVRKNRGGGKGLAKNYRRERKARLHFRFAILTIVEKIIPPVGILFLIG